MIAEAFQWPENTISNSQKFIMHFDQLHELLYRQYWARLWIIQEVCLARKLRMLYGRMIVDFEAFEHPQRRMESSLMGRARSELKLGKLSTASRL